LAVTSSDFLKLVRTSVPYEYFTSDVTATLVRVCYEYYDQFGAAPENHLHDELVRRIQKKDPEDRKLYTSYVTRISEMDPPNVDYVIKTISDFVRARTFEEAAVDFVKMVEKGRFEEARSLMHQALRAGVEKENVGLEYFLSDVPTYYNKTLDEVYLPTGIDQLDILLKGGIRRGWFVCILGGLKGRKSWFLNHMGKQGLLKGMNVLHISHEMEIEEIEERYDRNLGGLTGNRDGESSEITVQEMGSKGELIKEKKIISPSAYSLKAVKKVRRIWRKMGGRLIIKKYAMGTCTMNEIDRYLNYLETYYSFVPDLLINDYADIMSIPPSSRRESINQIYIDHKRIADERNITVMTVSQTNRAALLKAKLHQADFAEDIRKLANVDLALAISSDETQRSRSEMRAWIIGGRSVQDGRGCFIKQNLDIGQVCTDSWFPPDPSDKRDEEEEEDD
jgi:replicative DNA helicase